MARPDRPASDPARRWQFLRELDRRTEGPLVALSLVWLGLLVLELLGNLPPPLEGAVYLIWALFIVDFAVGIVIAPDRIAYLRSNWLTAVALLLPAARVFRAVRIVRLGRAARSLNLVRIVTSVNRGIRALGGTLARRGAGYVAAVTAIVALAGAAGMAAFESPAAIADAGLTPPPGRTALDGYADALWWTLMILVTLGSDYWPVTAEGRILTLLLAVYGFVVFGYVTATLASHFLGQDRATARESEERAPPGADG